MSALRGEAATSREEGGALMTTRTKPKDVFGAYGCIPRNWHPAYGRVSFYAHSITKAILEQVDDYSDLSIPTDGDWKTSLCRSLRIAGPERRNAKVAMESLLKARLMRVEAGRVRVLLVPDPELAEQPADVSRPCPVPCSVPCSVPVSVPLSVFDSDSTQAVENTHFTSRQLLSNSVSEPARAHTHETSPSPTPMPLRRRGHPMHSEPPPEARKATVPPTPPKPTLEDQLLQVWQGAVFGRLGRTPSASDQARAGAAQVAEWLRANVRDGESPLAVFQAALQRYLAETAESLLRNSYPLSWLVDRLAGYTTSVKPVAKVAPEPPKKKYTGSNDTNKLQRLYPNPLGPGYAMLTRDQLLEARARLAAQSGQVAHGV
jgi:hypothetical protein